MSGTVRIGIVGGGASAVCLLDALSRSPRVPTAVTVFEPSPHLWRGRAYQPDSPTLRVNAPPEDMSVRFGDPHHFARWTEARSLVLGTGSNHVDRLSSIPFMPRAMYGDYLEQSSRAAIMRLARLDCPVELIRQGVTGVEDTGKGLLLKSAETGRLVDSVVLCIGNGRPADTYGLAHRPGFIAEPYPVVRRLSVITPDEDVAVIGSGLTAVDIVLTLAAAGHRGRISLLSRSGVLPAVRQRPVDYTLRHFTPARFRGMAARGESLSLDEAFALMRTELLECGVDLARTAREVLHPCAEDPERRLRRHLAAVDDSDLGMRILQRAVPDTGPDVWPLLSEADKATLLRDHYRTIMSMCCPMPPSSATVLLDLLDSRQLEIVQGLESVEPLATGPGFRCTSRGTERIAHRVVNAVSPPAHRIPAAGQDLIRSLVSAGLATTHPRGGLHVERATSRLTVGGRAVPGLYALGDLAGGSLFFTFGVPSLVDRAYDISEAILGGSHTSGARHDDAMQTV